jgi:hypothetical protein
VQLWNAIISATASSSASSAPVPMGFGHRVTIEGRRMTAWTSRARSDLRYAEFDQRKHFQNRVNADDSARRARRFWDTFGDEADYRRVEPMIFKFAEQLPQRPMTTREYSYRLGLYFDEIGSQKGILTAAARTGVPIYCPAIGDSVLGMDLGFFRAEGGQHIVFDVVQDVLEMAALVLLAEERARRPRNLRRRRAAQPHQRSRIGTYIFATRARPRRPSASASSRRRPAAFPARRSPKA